MAGAGYKVFNTGDVLTASDVNLYLQQQVVMVFADSAARTSALSAVLAEGMVTYLQDTNSVQVYNGTAFVAVGGSSPLTTKGDLYTFSTVDARLGVGANGTTLVADSSEATGLKWQAPAASGGMTLISETTASAISSLDLNSIPGTYKDLLLVFSGIFHSNSSSVFILRFNADSGNNYKTHIGKMRSDSQVREENTSFTNADTDQPMFAGGMDGGSDLLKSCVGTLRITNYASTTKLKYYQAQYAQDTNLDVVCVLHGIYDSTSAITSLNWTRSAGAGTFSNESNTSILLYGVS